MIWPDGSKYEGQWLNGKENGTGTFTSAQGNIKPGIWKNGE